MMNTTSTAPARAAIAAYETGGHPRSPKAFTDHMRKASAQHVAATGMPLRRMSSPGGLSRAGTEPDGRNTVPVWVSDRRVMLAMPGQPPVRVTPENVNQVLRSARSLIMPVTPRAAAALETVLDRAGTQLGREVRQHVAVLRRMTASTQMLVLTSALARTFWTPTGTDEQTTSAWAALLGTTDDPDGWRELAGYALTPASDHEPQHADRNGVRTARAYGEQIQRIEDKMDPETLRRFSASSAASAYSLVSTVDACFDALCRTDPLLVPYYVLTGDVVELLRPEWQDHLMVCQMSTPAKVRTGDVIALLGNRVLNLTLDDIGYDEASGTLLGVFDKESSGNKGHRLHDVFDHAIDGRVFIIDAPFLGGRTGSTARWSRADESQMPELAVLNMPVDVAVAGAPVEG